MILLLLTAAFAAQERAVYWMPYGAAPLQDMAPQNDDIFTMIIYSFLTFDQSPNYLPSGPNNYSCPSVGTACPGLPKDQRAPVGIYCNQLSGNNDQEAISAAFNSGSYVMSPDTKAIAQSVQPQVTCDQFATWFTNAQPNYEIKPLATNGAPQIVVPQWVAACQNKKFVWGLGGWSDLVCTPTKKNATGSPTYNGTDNTDLDKIVTQLLQILLDTGADGIDFDFEHLSKECPDASRQARIEGLAYIMTQLRKKRHDIFISFTAALLSFVDANNTDVACIDQFSNAGEGIELWQEITKMGHNPNEVVDRVHNMMYDTSATQIFGPTTKQCKQTGPCCEGKSIKQIKTDGFSSTCSPDKIGCITLCAQPGIPTNTPFYIQCPKILQNTGVPVCETGECAIRTPFTPTNYKTIEQEWLRNGVSVSQYMLGFEPGTIQSYTGTSPDVATCQSIVKNTNCSFPGFFFWPDGTPWPTNTKKVNLLDNSTFIAKTKQRNDEGQTCGAPAPTPTQPPSPTTTPPPSPTTTTPPPSPTTTPPPSPTTTTTPTTPPPTPTTPPPTPIAPSPPTPPSVGIYGNPCPEGTQTISEKMAFEQCPNNLAAVTKNDESSSCSAPCNYDWQCYSDYVQGACVDNKCVHVCSNSSSCRANQTCETIYADSVSACMYACAIDISREWGAEDTTLLVFGCLDLILIIVVGIFAYLTYKYKQKNDALKPAPGIEMKSTSTTHKLSRPSNTLRLRF